MSQAQWAGTYACDVCRRKRLTAEHFSRRMLARITPQDTEPRITCTQCVANKAQRERDDAAASAEAKRANHLEPSPTECAACRCVKPAAAFSNGQLKKGPGKQRCVECVAKAEADEAAAACAKRDAALDSARAALATAEKSGTTTQKLEAAAKLSALEGELVTGLKPVVLGRGRGRGGGRSWRGRGR